MLTAEVVELARWAAAHYLAPLGPALKAALPPGIEVRDVLVPRLTEAGRALLEAGQLDLPGQEEAQRRALRKAASGARLSRALGATLARQGLVTLQRQEAPPRIAHPRVEVAQAAEGASPDAVRKAPRQAEVLAWLLARGGPVPVEELLAAFPRARPQLRGLVQRKLATVAQVAAGAAALPDAPWGDQRHDPDAGAVESAPRAGHGGGRARLRALPPPRRDRQRQDLGLPGSHRARALPGAAARWRWCRRSRSRRSSPAASARASATTWRCSTPDSPRPSGWANGAASARVAPASWWAPAARSGHRSCAWASSSSTRSTSPPTSRRTGSATTPAIFRWCGRRRRARWRCWAAPRRRSRRCAGRTRASCAR